MISPISSLPPPTEVTETLQDAISPPHWDDMVTVASPSPIAVIIPSELTVTTAVLLEDQINSESVGNTVAINCSEQPRSSDRLCLFKAILVAGCPS